MEQRQAADRRAASRRRSRLAALAGLAFTGCLVAGVSQAGAGLDLQDALPTDPGGGLLEDREECPAALHRLGLCKRQGHGHEPGDDFRPYDGGAGVAPEVHGADEHLHPRPRSHAGGRDHATGHTHGLTTLERTITGGDPDEGFQMLRLANGEPVVVREELAMAKRGRAKRRRSLLYLGQTTDWQLADEESPARVELLDIAANPPFPSTVSAAWRPQEALGAFAVEQSIRQVNFFADASPIAARNGRRAAMDMVLMTGDQADSQQFNETAWIARLLEGGRLDPNSGTDPASCPPLLQPSGQTADPRLYAGVQDFDDYIEGRQFYDPDQPAGPKYANWPSYPGLMDRAQEAFRARGLEVPSYVVLGNHDALAQGNQKAIAPFEAVGVGCIKPLVPVADLTEIADVLDPEYLLGLLTTDPSQVMLVPPDPRRRYVNREQYKEVFDTGAQADAHGFAYVDEAENEASNGAATYYAFTPKPGIRMIALETNCDGGVAGPSADGNIDHPQWQWLQGELRRASNRDQLIVVFGHHPIRSLTCSIPDEVPPPCTVDDAHGHDVNPGCDEDPRDSSPLHLGADLTTLFHRFPHVVAYIAGHTHENAISEFENASGGPGDFWGIETASLVDWPPQNRLIHFMDNCDGTLSIFGVAIDSSAPARAPASGTPAPGLTGADLGSISRTLAYNDPQAGAGTGEGEPADRNVELVVKDPREDQPCRERRAGPPGVDDGDEDDRREDPRTAGPTGDAGGSLPFTGFLVLGLAAVGIALASSGGLARRAGRR